MARPNLSSYFKGRIDWHTRGMLASTVRMPNDVARVKGDVTDRQIVVTMRDGRRFLYSGGQYSQRKVNLCYAPLMPKFVRELDSAEEV